MKSVKLFNQSKDNTNSGSNPIKGDLLVIAGATLYGVSNVSEEYFVKSADRIELMAFLGIFGAIVSAIQMYPFLYTSTINNFSMLMIIFIILCNFFNRAYRRILERDELKSIHWSSGATFPFFGFSLAMFVFYSAVPVLLKISGSTMLNLSLLTSDMWAVFIRIFAYHEKVDWMYYVAFAAVTVGLIVYSGGDKSDQNAREVADESKQFDEEASTGRPDQHEK
ncbi:UNVERIFIED_CONTAM: Solute carrier family 35 member F1 [Sesamum radiatum]|uniref:Solute carrier family 35 member F1 n=1 Tax=Sesamum radiatum TaxID=300843 RepID=A0AAW2SJA4_SESRA